MRQALVLAWFRRLFSTRPPIMGLTFWPLSTNWMLRIESSSETKEIVI